MRNRTKARHWQRVLPIVITICIPGRGLQADAPLLQKHCSQCHNDYDAEGDFTLSRLGQSPTADNLRLWIKSLDHVQAEEMPPRDESRLSSAERKQLVEYIEEQVEKYRPLVSPTTSSTPRRMNNREFANSISDVLLIEDVGTHQPIANLIGDSLHHGFDTHADTLGFSQFHLEQYLVAVRKIVDATILSGAQPETRRIDIPPERMSGGMNWAMDRRGSHSNTTRSTNQSDTSFVEFHDPRRSITFRGFNHVPVTGRYRITISATGKDRGLYSSKFTGIYPGDPIRLSVGLGDRVRTFDLPDETKQDIVLDEWIAAGTSPRLFYPTDGLTLLNNGNFKFQYAIAGMHLRETDPVQYQKVIDSILNNRTGRRGKAPTHWQHWKYDYAAPRPVIYGAVVEGPFYESWPPKRQVALLGTDPTVARAAEILRPIAERAWRRPVRPGELDPIVALIERTAKQTDEIEALKEGIVSILVSPSFLLLNTEDLSEEERFASKFSFFVSSTTPDTRLLGAAEAGKLDTFDDVRELLEERIKSGRAEAFLNAFPKAWLLLADINFMAPDVETYLFYHRKRISEDMTNEVLAFFRHAVENNIPLPEFLSADYSFINRDLAKVYGIDDVPEDSTLRQYRYADGRRGGLLGMGAFLTITADSQSTSPIHRAKYVMENFLGIQPTPPPPTVNIEEPDVRQAISIREILAKHRSDSNCMSCHEKIDPWGFAFENFGPTGAWRDRYTITTAEGKRTSFPVDASAEFPSGVAYRNIEEFRAQLLTDVNRDRFVRCIITKLLTYANGVEPDEADFVEINEILARSAKHGYRTMDTIAAVIDSPLFRRQ